MLQKRRLKQAACIISYLIFLSAFTASVSSEPDPYWIKRLLQKDKQHKIKSSPKERIYRKDDILYCTGTGKAATLNNKAAGLLAKGEYDAAITLFKKGLKKQALFLPFRYNIGLCYIKKKQYKKASLHLTKAMLILPHYTPTLIQLGYIHELMFKPDTALDYYRKALRANKKEIRAYVLIGDLYFKRKQYTLANRFYTKCLQFDYKYADALLGKAKIHYIKKEYHQAMLVLKTIDTTRGRYDKSLHYYYGECAYKLRDYITASKHYTILLKHKTDKFFLTHDPGYVEYKLKLSDKLKLFQMNRP